MADIIALAQDFYDSALDEDGVPDDEQITAMKEIRNTLRTAIANGTTTGVLTSATKNGVSYAQRAEIGPTDRLRALSIAIIGLESSTRPGRVAFVRF